MRCQLLVAGARSCSNWADPCNHQQLRHNGRLFHNAPFHLDPEQIHRFSPVIVTTCNKQESLFVARLWTNVFSSSLPHCHIRGPTPSWLTRGLVYASRLKHGFLRTLIFGIPWGLDRLFLYVTCKPDKATNMRIDLHQNIRVINAE